MPTVVERYGLLQKRKPTVVEKYGLAKPTSVSAQLGMGIEESIIGKGLGLLGIEDEIPKVEPQTILQKAARGIGAFGADLPLYVIGGGIPGAIVKKSVSPLISAASAFALPDATRETLRQVEEGEGISPTKIATEGAKGAALGATIGAISKIPIKGIKGQAVKFPLETGAFAEAQALEQGRVVPTTEEAIVAGLFLGSLKGFNTALSYGAKKLAIPEKELQKQVKEKAQKENKTQQEALAGLSGLQKEWDAFVKKANEDLDADLAKVEARIIEKGVALEAQVPQEAQKEVIKPFPPAPTEQIAPPAPIPGIKGVGAGKGLKIVWRANKEGGQTVGNKQIIRKPTLEDFEKELLPVTRKGFYGTGTVEQQYQNMLKKFPDMAISFIDKGKGWEFAKADNLENIQIEIQNGIKKNWAKKVKDFDAPEAVQWRKTFDSDLAPSAPPTTIPVEPGAGKGKVFYTAERTVGDVKDGPSLGTYLTDDASIAQNYAGQQGQVRTVMVNSKNPLKITSVNREFPEIFSTEEINQILANAGVKYKFTDNTEQEFFRFADGGGTAFIKAVKNTGYDAIKFPDVQGNKIFETTLVFDKQNIKDLAPSAPPQVGIKSAGAGKGVKEPWEMTKEEFDKAFWFHGQPASKKLGEKIYGGLTKFPDLALAYAQRGGESGTIYLLRDSDLPIGARQYLAQDLVMQRKIAAAVGERTKTRRLHITIPGIGTVPGKIAGEFPAKEAKDPHRYFVQKALSEGKPVPPEVLKDYPNLVPSAPPAPPLETTLKAAKPPVVPEATLPPVGPQLRREASEVSPTADIETRGVEGAKVKEVSAKPLSQKYFIYNIDKSEFVEVEGTPIEIKGLKGDFFIHKSIRDPGWVISEGKTGASLAEGTTKKKALEKAQEGVGRGTKTQEGLETIIKALLGKTGGESPRYAGVRPAPPRDILQEQIAKAEKRVEAPDYTKLSVKELKNIEKNTISFRELEDVQKELIKRGKRKETSIEAINKIANVRTEEQTISAPKPPTPPAPGEAGITAETLAEKYPEASIKVKPAKEGYTGQAEYEKATYTVSGKTEAEVLEKLDKRLASVVPYEEPQPTRKREPEATAMTPEELENIVTPEERLSGGKPGEFKPEQADAQREMEVAFKKAQDALQHGDKPNHQKAMQEIKNLADKMDAEKYARLQEPKRVISDREVAARAAEMPVEKAEAIIAKGAQGETTTAAEVLKQRAEINTAELHSSLPKDRPITEADIPDLMAKTTKTIESLQAAEAGPSEAGRTLRKADLQRKLRESLETLKRRAEREPKRAAEFFDLWAKTDPTNPEAVERFLLSVTEPKFFDYIYEIWYSSILSGLPTHVANVNSTGLWTGWQIPHRFMRAAAEYPIAAIQGRPRQYSFQEAFILWNGYKQGIKEGWAKSWNILMNGALEDDMTKWGVEMGKSVEAFNRSPYKPLRWAGKLIGIPGRALRAEDTFFKAIAWHGGIAVKAHEKAWADANKLGLKGQAWNDKVGEMVEFYTRKPTPDMLEKAKTFAQYSTFNDAPGGLTNAVLSLRNAVPGSRFLIPFVNTISNLLQRGLEITPGIGLALERGRALGPEAADVAAKQMTGIAAVTALWLATKYIDGEMTGALPQNTAEREAFYRQGKLPWAFGFNDPRTGKRTYISYRRIEPFNTLFATIASWGDAFRDKEETPTAEKVASLVIRLGKNLLDGSYLSQFNQAIIAINMGDRGIESTEKIVQRLATSFIPFSSALRSGTKALEAAEEGEVVLRKPETIGEAVRENVPFVKKTALPKRDVTGKEIVIPGGPIRQLLPYKLSVKQEDVVEDELARLKIFPSMPSRRIGGEELPDKEYAKYVELQGGIWRPQLYQVMSRPGWKRMPEFAQRALVKQIVNQAREIARIRVRPNYRFEALQKQILGSPVESIE